MARLGRQDPTGLTSVLPAAGGFRYYSVVSNDPVVTPDAYRLNVGGLVESPRTMTFADLAIFEHWKMTAKPAILIGMDVLGIVDTLIIDYRRRELQIRTRKRS